MEFKLYVCLSALTLVSAAATVVKGEEVQPYAIPGRYIVVLKHGHLPSEVARGHGLRPQFNYSRVLNGFAGAVPEGRLHALKNDPRVEYLEADLQLFVSAQTLPSGVKRIGAALSGMANINGVDERVNADIAILDTGIALHPDLNIASSVSFISGQMTDGNGHGTHVAGIAAALDNSFGVVGVAPGARLWDVKVLDDNGSGTISSLIQGIDYVTQHADQIEVANMSLAGIGYSYSLRQAIINSVAKGVVYVASAGNASRDIYGPDGLAGTGDDSIPAAYPEVAAISALSDLDGIASDDDALADFSNYSRGVVVESPVASYGAAIDLAAPGVNIYSTHLNGGYATMSGTSMAAPHVAGAAALYIAAHGRATNAVGVAAIRQALINSAQPQSAWGSADTADPDPNPESLVSVASIAPAFNNVPVVTLSAPTNGANFAYGSAILFTGSASDAEDGNRTSSLVWTSSKDGRIGTGGSFSKALSAGAHTITATVTDSGGKTSTRSTAITVVSALSVTVTANKPVYLNRSKVYITATVTDGVNPVSGAAAHLEVVTPSGNRITKDTVTDAIGVAQFQYAIFAKRDGYGTCTATVTGSVAGSNPGTGSVTYTVTK